VGTQFLQRRAGWATEDLTAKGAKRHGAGETLTGLGFTLRP
jgi:hypothetical protein